MENASKALIIAGAILIAMMITSLGVLIFSQWNGRVKDSSNLDEQAIQNFNAKITPYLGTRISGSQVNALLQYCLSNNMGTEEDYMKITVSQGGTNLVEPASTSYTKVTTGVYYTLEGTRNAQGLIVNININ